MPRTSYANAKIYCIRSYQTDQMYIGSTCDDLSKRLSSHRSKYKRWNTGKTKIYVTSFEIIKHGDAYIELLEHYPCGDKYELTAREGHWIRRCRVACNKRIAGRTDAEYYQDHKEELKAYQNQYYKDHKQEAAAYRKQHYQDNKQEEAAYKKQYYQANKDKYVCYECEYRCNQNGNLTKHRKTKKHLSMVKFLIELMGPDYNNVE